MTALPEAKLAREAEICFVLIAMVTDYDCWREAEEDVTLDMVLQVMRKNSAAIKGMIPALVSALRTDEDCDCRHAASKAIVTDPKLIPIAVKRRLSLFYGKYWKG
jgi:5'-methylthioadenosine phosphorylase